MQRALHKQANEGSDSEEAPNSPKKTRSSFNASFNREKVQCVCCELFEEDSDIQIFRARSPNCGKNLFKWALESKNWEVYARLNTSINAEDTEAGDVHLSRTMLYKAKK